MSPRSGSAIARGLEAPVMLPIRSLEIAIDVVTAQPGGLSGAKRAWSSSNPAAPKVLEDRGLKFYLFQAVRRCRAWNNL